jgi:uncharacterized membrane protein YhaH (DUF805 family)
MTDTHYKIMFEGQVREGVSLETAKLNLANLFKSEASAVEKLFNGQSVTLKRGISYVEAERYLKALNENGVQARIEEDPEISFSLDEAHQRPQPTPYAAPVASPYMPPGADVSANLPRYSTLKVFSVQGRIGRARYLAWTLVMSVILILSCIVCLLVMSVDLTIGGLLAALLAAAFICVNVQIGVQRAHDAGWSGWVLLLNLVPFVSSIFPIVLVAMPGNAGPNRYGPPAPPNTRAVKILAWMWVVLIAVLIYGSVAGGLAAFQEQIEASTIEYEQSLPADDDLQTDTAEPSARFYNEDLRRET